MLVPVDHIVISVQDLKNAARAVASLLGRDVEPGGTHHDSGTANAIIPFGNGYLELVTVVDSAAAADHPFGRLVSMALADGFALAGWAAPVSALTELPPSDAGSQLSRDDASFTLWGVDAGRDRADRPFFVGRETAAESGPQVSAPGRIRKVGIAVPADAEPWPELALGDVDVEVAASSAVKGALHSVTVDHQDGTPVVITEHGWRSAELAAVALLKERWKR